MVRLAKDLLGLKLIEYLIDSEGVPISLSRSEHELVMNGKLVINKEDNLKTSIDDLRSKGDWRKVQVMKRSYIISLTKEFGCKGVTNLFERDVAFVLKKCNYSYPKSVAVLQEFCTQKN